MIVPEPIPPRVRPLISLSGKKAEPAYSILTYLRIPLLSAGFWPCVAGVPYNPRSSKVEGFESDNDANGSTLTPQTKAIFSNFTLIGPRATLDNVGNSLFLAGVQIRRNSSISIFNSLIMGWPTGILIDASKGSPTDWNIRDSNLLIKNTIIAGSATPIKYSASATEPTGASSTTINDWFLTAAYGNAILATNDDVKLTAPFTYGDPDLSPQSGSSVLSGASFTDPKLGQFTQVDYRGAVGAGDSWYKGWTKF